MRRLRPGGGESGLALLLAVWALALLTVIGGEFLASGRVRAAAERNRRDDLRARALALAGYRAALATLDDHLAGLSVDEGGKLLLHYHGSEAGVPAAAADQALGDGTYSYTISDEEGLVNVNAVQATVLRSLLEQCGMELGAERDTVIDSILDWRDPNREHRLNGAEEDYYRGLDPPYSAKDAPFDVIEELLLVRGVTPALFAGGEVDGKARPGLRALLTPHTATDDPANLATAPRAVLDALGKTRPARPSPPSAHYAIVATGRPGGGAPPRALRAVVRREDAGDSRSFTLLYWNDAYAPE
jgi:hypothetical protein